MKLSKLMPAVLLIMASTFALAACTVKPSSPPAPDSLATKILSTSEVQIVQTSARQDGENIVVDGQVRRTVTGGRGIIKGHIDIGIIDTEGNTIGRVVTNVSPEIIPNRGVMTSSFTTRIPLVAPQGSVVRVRFHNGPHDSE
ncbi:MAG: hypothetical protein JZU65_18190 [Chlorobium sp.]|nr:hypothetical protein [Chlorobium sp.]